MEGKFIEFVGEEYQVVKREKDWLLGENTPKIRENHLPDNIKAAEWKEC